MAIRHQLLLRRSERALRARGLHPNVICRFAVWVEERKKNNDGTKQKQCTTVHRRRRRRRRRCLLLKGAFDNNAKSSAFLSHGSVVGESHGASRRIVCRGPEPRLSPPTAIARCKLRCLKENRRTITRVLPVAPRRLQQQQQRQQQRQQQQQHQRQQQQTTAPVWWSRTPPPPHPSDGYIRPHVVHII